MDFKDALLSWGFHFVLVYTASALIASVVGRSVAEGLE